MSEMKLVAPKLRFPEFTGDWEQRKFKDFTFAAGKRNKANLPLEPYAITNDKGFIAQKDAHDDFGYMKDTDRSAYMIVKPNSFAYNPARINVGSIGYYDGNDEVIVSSLYEVFQTVEDVNDRFLWHWLKSPALLRWIEKLQEGSVRLYFYYDKMQECTLMMPAFDEQKKIADCIDALDNTIALRQRKLDEMKEYKKGLLQKMFPRDGKTVPEIRFPEFTGDWEQRKFGELFVERREKTKTENEDVLLSCAINGMFLNSELFDHFRGSSTIGYLKVKKNDLILSAQNLHLGNANVNMRFDSGIISPAYKVYDIVGCTPEFAQAWVKQDSTKQFFLAATTEGASQCRKNIEWKTLYQQEVKVPSIEEQQKIGSFIFTLNNTIALHQRKLDAMKEYKKGLLQQMFV